MAQPPYGQPQPPQNQPPYGQAPPPYGQQPQYGQTPPPYGQPQPGYGPPGPYPGPGAPGGYGPPKQGNGFSVAGVCLSVLPLFGLIFSIIGVVKSKARGGAGRTLGIIGIVLSLVFAVVYITLDFTVLKSAAAGDPGCVAVKTAMLSSEGSLKADDQQIEADAGNTAKEQTDLQKFTGDAQGFVSQLKAAANLSANARAKAAMTKTSGDLTTMLSDLRAVESGDTSKVSQMESLLNGMNTDGKTLSQACKAAGVTFPSNL